MENFRDGDNTKNRKRSDKSADNQAVNPDSPAAVLVPTVAPEVASMESQGNAAADGPSAENQATSGLFDVLLAGNPELRDEFNALAKQNNQNQNNNNNNNKAPVPLETLTHGPATVLSGFLGIKDTSHVARTNKHNFRLFMPLTYKKAYAEEYQQYLNYFWGGEIENAMAVLEKNPHVVLAHNFNKFDWASPLTRAAWGEDKALFYKMINILKVQSEVAAKAKQIPYQPIPTEVYELYYLVVTGLGKRVEDEDGNYKTWAFDAKHYVEANLEKFPDLPLIEGPDGASALQRAAAQLDFDLIEVLLLPITKKPEEVATALDTIKGNKTLSAKEKYQLINRTLIDNLPNDDKKKYKDIAEAQLKAVRDNNWVLPGEPIIKEYTDCKTFCDNDQLEEAVEAARRATHCQYQLSRAIYASILFHKNGSNYPNPPNPYEIHPPRDFIYYDWDKEKDVKLYPANYKKLGKKGDEDEIIIFRVGASWASRARLCAGAGAALGLGAGLNAVVGVFKMRIEQLNDLINAFSPAPAPIQHLNDGP